MTTPVQLDTLIHGKALAALREIPENTFDALCIDPPAGIAFMGKNWDTPDTFPLRNGGKRYTGNGNETNAIEGFAKGINFDNSKRGRDAFISFLTETMTEALRTLKPGAHGLVWALPRTSHWTATALENAGFEVRDCVYHVFGSGMPKSHNISKAIDRMAGAEREVLETRKQRGNGGQPRSSLHYIEMQNGKTIDGRNTEFAQAYRNKETFSITAPATPEAQAWNGWGTSLKPAVECWWLVRKPLGEKTIASNVLRWGTGALNIDASRVAGNAPIGRWPAHLLLAHSLFCSEDGCDEGCPVRQMDEQSGTASRYFAQFSPESPFVYSPKASKAERNKGCEANTHPTVKPVHGLMRYLLRMICPPGGTVLDCFAGSGSTLVAAIHEGMHFLGVEMNDTEDEPYCTIARARIAQAYQETGGRPL